MEKQDIEKVFLLRLSRLSNRAGLVLQSLRLYDFKSFFNFFIKERRLIDFSQMRNCGTKAGKELNSLINCISELKSEQLTEGREDWTAFSGEVELLFDRNFDELTTRTKNILSAFGANYIYGFNEKILMNNAFFDIKKLRNCGAKSYDEICQSYYCEIW